MLEMPWDGLKKFCFLHGFRNFWIRGGKSIRLEFFLTVLLFSATVQKLRMCFLQFSSCFYCFRRKGFSKQYVPGKPSLQLVTQLHLVFIAVSALSKLRPGDCCGLKVASISFQLLLNMPSNSCCPPSDCPYNKPSLLERMVPWVWYEGKKANPEKLVGHRWNLSSSCQEVLQDSASGGHVAHHRVVLQWHILASA